MAVNSTKNNIAYGLNNALQNLSPLPIVARRAPQTTDIGEIGQTWIYNNTVWMFTSRGTWTELEGSGSAGSFSTLTVSGASSLQNASISGSLTVTGSVVSNKVTSASTTVTNSSVVGTTTITGLTTASAGTFTVTMTNTNITTTSGVIVTASNLNASTNNAHVAVSGVVTAANTLIITVINNGAGALGTGDNVHISHMILS